MIRMLLLLRKNGKLQVSEIAKLLNITPRMVREYKKRLKEIGVVIGSKTGIYGGYYIEKDNFLLGIGLTNEEIKILKQAKKYIKDKNLLQEYIKILNKFK